MHVLVTNEKMLRLWKMSKKNIKKVMKGARNGLNMSKLQIIENKLILTG